MPKEWGMMQVKRETPGIVKYIEDKEDVSPLENAFLAYAKLYKETDGSAKSSIAVYVERVKIPFRTQYKDKKGKLKTKKESMIIDVPYMDPGKEPKNIMMFGDEAEAMLARLGPLVEERMQRA